MRITADTLRTLKPEQTVRYTAGEGDKRIEAITSVALVLSDCLRLRIVELVEQGSASHYIVGQTIMAMPGMYETLELLPN